MDFLGGFSDHTTTFKSLERMSKAFTDKISRYIITTYFTNLGILALYVFSREIFKSRAISYLMLILEEWSDIIYFCLPIKFVWRCFRDYTTWKALHNLNTVKSFDTIFYRDRMYCKIYECFSSSIDPNCFYK